MKYNQSIVAFLFFLASQASIAQNITSTQAIKRNTFFAEVGGNAMLYSVNYDRLLKVRDTWRLTSRIGFMYLNTLTSQNRNLVGVPIEFSYLRGNTNHFFELGLGLTAIHDQYQLDEPAIPIRQAMVKELITIAALRFGYRYQKNEGGIFYKVGFTPLHGLVFDLRKNTSLNSNTSTSREKFTYPLVGAAIGWTFKT